MSSGRTDGATAPPARLSKNKNKIMGHVIKRLKLNRHRCVSIPSNKDLFQRVGQRVLPPMADGQVADYNNSTMENLDYIESQLLKDSQIPPDGLDKALSSK